MCERIVGDRSSKDINQSSYAKSSEIGKRLTFEREFNLFLGKSDKNSLSALT